MKVDATRCRIPGLVALLAGCFGTPYSRPPALPATSAAALQVGDVVSYRVGFDDVLGGNLTVDANGDVHLPGCDSPTRVAGGDLHAIEDDARRCLVSGNVYENAPLVHAWVSRPARNVHVKISSPPAERAVASTEVGSLMGALTTTLSGPRPDAVTLMRAGTWYRIDVEAISAGEAADVPLAPGDVILIAEASSLRAEAPVGPPRDPPPDSPRFDVAHATCGQLALRKVRLESLHFGPAHPELIAVNQEILRTCDDQHGGESLVAACDDARRDLADSEAAGLGPKHPEVQALSAELVACPPRTYADTPAPPTEAQCATLRAERATLLANGKGPRHPAVITVDARLASCGQGP